MLQNSSAVHHETLRRGLQNDFMKGVDQYPKNRAQALMFFDRYSKSVTPVVNSEGYAFAQKATKGKKPNSNTNADEKKDKDNKDDKSGFDKETYKDKICFKSNAGKRGILSHIAKKMTLPLHQVSRLNQIRKVSPA